MNDIYENGSYLEQNQTWHLEDSAWKASHISNMLRQNEIKPNSICEVGSGAGGILRSLAEIIPACKMFVGYEISPQAMEICRRNGGPDCAVDFRLGSIIDEDVFFDVLLVIDVIEHVEDCFKFMRALKSKASYKIFHIPLDLSVASTIRGNALVDTRHKVGHIHYFNKKLALAIMEEAGYEVIDHFYTYGAVDHPTKSFKRLAAKIPRKLLYMMSQDWAARLLGGASLLVLAK